MNHADARRSPPRGHEPTQAAKGRPAWRTWSLRVLTLVFFVVVGALVMHQLRTMEWATVGQALRSYRIGTLALAASLGLCSYAVYACYELMARRYSGHRLPIWLTAAVGVISYSFNLNLGVWLGGIGFRYRLYSQLGVDTPTTAKLYASTLVTNWSGYLALAGAVFTLYGLDLPPQWKLSDMGLRWIGALLLVAATGWLLACWCSPRREWALRGHAIALPPGRMAAAQMALGCANWSLMAGVVYVLLPHVPSGPGYGAVLGALLLAAIAGVAAHIPAGLGVLEAVFLALLGHRVPHAQILGALLAYRAIYFLAPLTLTGLSYALLEARIRRPARG
jgi:uncharacterized membrane protein YbhN (UPF0104 family)